jgi:hypothetical protein
MRSLRSLSSENRGLGRLAFQTVRLVSFREQLLFPIEDVPSPVSSRNDGESFNAERKEPPMMEGQPVLLGRNLICVVDLKHHHRILFEGEFT